MTSQTTPPPPRGYQDRINVALLRQLRLLATGWKTTAELRVVLGLEHTEIAGQAMTLLRNTYLIQFRKRGEIWYVGLTDTGVDFCLKEHI